MATGHRSGRQVSFHGVSVDSPPRRSSASQKSRRVEVVWPRGADVAEQRSKSVTSSTGLQGSHVGDALANPETFVRVSFVDVALNNDLGGLAGIRRPCADHTRLPHPARYQHFVGTGVKDASADVGARGDSKSDGKIETDGLDIEDIEAQVEADLVRRSKVVEMRRLRRGAACSRGLEEVALSPCKSDLWQRRRLKSV
mmetsp:Transcript_85525/g.222484  ORF Transcript_85525/g.222484 Transcript_85525/m.222484 type:complete len:198 (-) Transcript_85525:30-623(-)